MKYIAAASVLIVCTVIGFKRSHNLTEKASEMTELIYFLNFFRNELIYIEAPVMQIVSRFAEDRNCRHLPFIMVCNELCENLDFPEAWKKAVEISKMHVDEDVKSILYDFSDKIGTSDTETQLRYLDYYILQLEQLLCNAKNEENTRKKLYIVLGFTTGLILGIMII